MLNVITWLWGDAYTREDVNRLVHAVRYSLQTPHNFHVFTDNPLLGFDTRVHAHAIENHELIGRHCFCRLRMFDPVWQRRHGLFDTIVALDLDSIVTGQLDPLFKTENTFMILQGANAANPNPYNASVMLLRAGDHADIWQNFSLEAASKIRKHDFADDQGWIWHMMPHAKGWRVGKASGIYAFQKPGWPGGTALPVDARLVVFFGWRKPQKFLNVPWIGNYWNDAA